MDLKENDMKRNIYQLTCNSLFDSILKNWYVIVSKWLSVVVICILNYCKKIAGKLRFYMLSNRERTTFS